MEVSYEDIKRVYEPKGKGFCGHKSHRGTMVRAFPLEYYWLEDSHTIVCDWCLEERIADGDSPNLEAYSFEDEETRWFVSGFRTVHPEPPHVFDGGPA